ncbi:metallopeptidase family protein [Proteiniborus sp. MB09-C3]|uniref:metallopeptidase family protein n=1 Tax=Proteiniborus sp. MB09-C3 TaxID=3050072 RepID=UPI0025562C80|nr:metallopeptidase family protein [Proteiniborus sp. MB09-C3]WIV11460.1 metallopeptidase family protein [Proteiniborus sp. MB09-C3]
MDDFPTIEEIHEILDDIAEEIPDYFFEQLNGGIILLPEYKIHPESRDVDTLYIMGEYSRSLTGRHIAIYYGSFKKVYSDVSMRALRNKLKDTLLHEFTHHLESLAGERGLEIKDFQDMQEYRKKKLD